MIFAVVRSKLHAIKKSFCSRVFIFVLSGFEATTGSTKINSKSENNAVTVAELKPI